MKPTEPVQILLWLSRCIRSADYYLEKARAFAKEQRTLNVQRCLTAVRSMRANRMFALRNYARLSPLPFVASTDSGN